MEREFFAAQIRHKDILAEDGIGAQEAFDVAMREPPFTKKICSGEVLELKVDPKECFVTDMAIWNEAMGLISFIDGDFDPIDAQLMAMDYWGSLVRLEDFINRYDEHGPDSDHAYTVKPEAPVMSHQYFDLPEILIPSVVPPNLIRVIP